MRSQVELPAHWIGLASDLLVAPPEVVTRRAGEAIAVHHPTRRDFHDVNALWPTASPSPRDLPGLLETWEEEFGGTGVIARILCWEESGAEEPAGCPWGTGDSHGDFRLSRLEVLRCTRPRDVPRAAGLEVRAVTTDDDWAQLVELNLAVHDFGDRIKEDFCRWMIGQRHRRACESGRATWWAAWSEGRPLGAAGLYAGVAGPARFQEVVTHRDHRRRGVCTTLISTLLERGSPEGFLLIASCGSEAQRIYHRLGFEPSSRVYELFQRLPGEEPK